MLFLIKYPWKQYCFLTNNVHLFHSFLFQNSILLDLHKSIDWQTNYMHSSLLFYALEM